MPHSEKDDALHDEECPQQDRIHVIKFRRLIGGDDSKNSDFGLRPEFLVITSNEAVGGGERSSDWCGAARFAR